MIIKRIKQSILLGLALIAINCGVSPIGYIGHHTNTQVILKEANYKVIGQVSGEASASFILGFGPTNSRLYSIARRQLHNNAKLSESGKSRALINLTTDIQFKWIIYPLIYFTKTVTVSADVIQFI